jgi:dinuclear metal center YbgI/SA1388 family protein
MKIHEVTKIVEEIAPLHLQESYDNSGLLIGSANDEVTAVLCTVDVTPEVIDEAVSMNVNLILSHHPIIFEPLASLTGKTPNERAIMKAIESRVSIYAAHTNLDNSSKGVNHIVCQKLGLANCSILKPFESYLYKLVTFVPESHAAQIRESIFAAGAGHIGKYDCCSYNSTGTGTFRAGSDANPYLGEKGKVHNENEIRIETIVPKDLISKVVEEMKHAHPYEEVAYDLYPLSNTFANAGSGMIGELDKALPQNEFLNLVKTTFRLSMIRYAGNPAKKIKRVALCGGSGIFLLERAVLLKADAFLTGDIKYHQFSEADDRLLLCDIGHYESEQFTKEIFYLLLKEKISTFAVHLSKIITNPIKYYF